MRGTSPHPHRNLQLLIPSPSHTRALQLSLGADFGCALRVADSTPICWGSNVDGRSTPPDSAQVYEEIAVGPATGCGRRASGLVDCWGAVPSDQGLSNTYSTIHTEPAWGVCGLLPDGVWQCFAGSTSGPYPPIGLADISASQGMASSSTRSCVTATH